MSLKSEAEINAEKASKPAIDVTPPELTLAAGRALGYGQAKHGVATPDGWGTWRVAGTQQAEPLTHYSCLMRHLLQWRAGEERDPESGLSHLDHAAAQLAILLDLLARPVPGGRPMMDFLNEVRKRQAEKEIEALTVEAASRLKDPNNDADWPLPEGWKWLSGCGPGAREWYADGPEDEGTRCADPMCCDGPADVVLAVRERNA